MIALSFAAALTLSSASTEVPSFDAYPIQMVIDSAEGQATGSVILVAGTGAFDRDVAFGRSGTERDKLFADLAQRMTRRGLDVVRFDRRGVRYGVEDAERLDPNAVPGLTAEAFSRDVEAVYDRVRQTTGRAGRCVVFLAHSEGAAHVAGLAERGAPAPALVLGVGAPMEHCWAPMCYIASMSTEDDHTPAVEAGAVFGETSVQRALRLRKAAIDARPKPPRGGRFQREQAARIKSGAARPWMTK